jgi:deoxyribonucleoside regulator
MSGGVTRETRTSGRAGARGERGPVQRSDALLTDVALLYYKDGLTQSEIAKRLRVSRASVVNYLKQAHEQSIVDIRIDGTSYTSSKLSRDLRDAYGLEDVYVASVHTDPRSGPRQAAEEAARQVARVGAMAVHSLVRPGDVLGVTWGRTVHRLSEEMPRGRIPDLAVCQTIGSMRSHILPSAESIAIRIAAALGAECHTLHAPAVVSTPELAEALRREPIIHAQLAELGRLTKVLFAAGNVQDSTTIVGAGIVTAQEMHWYRDRGAVGVICGRFIDAQGRHVVGEMDARMIGITLEQLRRSVGILVAYGVDRLEAIRAALAGGHARYLVVDEATGAQLLALARTAERRPSRAAPDRGTGTR